MSILTCECTPQMTNEFEKVDEYRNPRYELLSHDKNALTIDIYSSVASGVHYTEGAAEIVQGFLLLTCDTRSDPDIAFELVPWKLTFAITYDGEINLDSIYFQDNKLAGPDILQPLRSDD